MANIERHSSVFRKNCVALADDTLRYISNCGGTRSGKTYSILQLLNYVVANKDAAGDVTSVVSETLPHLKKGAIRDFERIIGHPLRFDARWNESDHTYTYTNGAKIEFFSVDAAGKVQGPARKRLFVNEANHIKYETFRQLDIRTTAVVFIDYNPTAEFWAMTRVENLPECITIRSTYKDNEFLTPEQVRAIESNRTDANWWRVFGEGLVGVNEGVIYSFEQIDELPDPSGLVETYGMDFGFTHDPSVLVHTLIDTAQRRVYFDEVFYQRGMLNADMIAAMESAGVPRSNVMIFADCAEPKTIEELYRAGWNVLPCYKATKKAEQVQILRGYQHFITKRSVNAIREHRGYVWAQDKEGNNLNEPIAFNDHFEDAARYSVMSYLVEYGGGGARLGFGYDYDNEEDDDI